MTRLFLATVIGVLLVAVYDRAADSVWAVPLAVMAVVLAIAVTFTDDRERRNLELWERRERLRDEKRRRAA